MNNKSRPHLKTTLSDLNQHTKIPDKIWGATRKTKMPVFTGKMSFMRKRRKNQVRSYVLTRVDFLGTISREVVFPWNSIHLQVKTQQVNNISCKIYLNLSTIFCVTYTAYTARCDSTGKEAFSSSKEFLAVVDLIAGAHLGNNMHRQNIS